MAINPDVLTQIEKLWGDRNPIPGLTGKPSGFDAVGGIRGGLGGREGMGGDGMSRSIWNTGGTTGKQIPWNQLPPEERMKRIPGLYEKMNDPFFNPWKPGSLTPAENVMFRSYFPNIYQQ